MTAWADEVGAVGKRIGRHFARSEPSRRVRARAAERDRAEERWHLGDPTQDRGQHLLARADWDADAVRDDLLAYVAEHLGHPEGVLVVDETGFLKEGTKSCGVARQYSGTAGRIENCQVGVFLGYVTTKGPALLDRALYLPKDSAGDADGRHEAGVPEGVGFATKIVRARQMIDRAVAAGVPARWVTADAVYGSDSHFRTTEVPADAWHRLSCGAGSKGPRVYDWAAVRTNAPEPDRYARWVLIRRSVADPAEVAYFACGGPRPRCSTSWCGSRARWAIEDLFALAKGDCGLDEHEVRSWTGWHRHVTLSLFALAVVAVIRSRVAKPVKKGARR